jgi:hypothetical protein
VFSSPAHQYALNERFPDVDRYCRQVYNCYQLGVENFTVIPSVHIQAFLKMELNLQIRLAINLHLMRGFPT